MLVLFHHFFLFISAISVHSLKITKTPCIKLRGNFKQAFKKKKSPREFEKLLFFFYLFFFLTLIIFYFYVYFMNMYAILPHINVITGSRMQIYPNQVSMLKQMLIIKLWNWSSEMNSIRTGFAVGIACLNSARSLHGSLSAISCSCYNASAYRPTLEPCRRHEIQDNMSIKLHWIFFCFFCFSLQVHKLYLGGNLCFVQTYFLEIYCPW